MMDLLRELESVVARASQPMVAAGADAAPPPLPPPPSSESPWLALWAASPRPLRRLVLRAEEAATSYLDLEGRSPSELRFLASVFLAVLLFAVILPACEAMSEALDEEKKRERRRRRRRERCSKRSRRNPAKGPAEPGSRMRVYKPGLGVVEVDVEEVAETTLARASSGGSSSSGRRSVLETIEESEEEEEEEPSGATQAKVKVDEKMCDSSMRSHDEDDLLLDTPTSSPPATPEQRQARVFAPSDLSRRLQESFDEYIMDR